MTRDDVLSGHAGFSEESFELTLRPRHFGEFVGQAKVVENLQIWIKAARHRGEAMDHALFSGPPGLGKTTLANIVAAEMEADIITTSGPGMDRPRDLAGLLTKLKKGDILFIDEIHRVNVSVAEYLYAAMEDYFIDIMIDQGPNARSLRLNLEPFTLIGATTREGLLPPPLRARFGVHERLDYYPPVELQQIISNSARILGCDIDSDAAGMLAERARGTPRIANRFLRRIRDVAHAEAAARIDKRIVESGLKRLGVDESGLSEMDRRIMAAIAGYEGRPVGIKSIAVMVSEEEDTIEEVYEPYLIQNGYIEKTPRGRLLTIKGAEMAGKTPVDNGQKQKGLF